MPSYSIIGDRDLLNESKSKKGKVVLEAPRLQMLNICSQDDGRKYELLWLGNVPGSKSVDEKLSIV